MQFLSCLALAVLVTFATPAHGDTLVLAAASLTDVLDEMIGVYARESGRKVKVSYAASSILARQIEAGSPGQIFISADLDWMKYLQQRNIIAGEAFILAGNRLVLIAPADSAVSVKIAKGMNLRSVLGSERLATGDPASVPAGKYARAALEYYGEWEAMKGRILPMDNVRVALLVVAEHEAPLGIVYATDVRSATGVRVVDVFPEASHAPIVYPAGVVRGHENDAEVNAFYAYLKSKAAAALLAKHGFTQPR